MVKNPNRKQQAKVIRAFRRVHRTMGATLFVFFFVIFFIFIFTKGIQVLTKTQSYSIKYEGPEKTTLQRIKDFVK